VKQCLELQPNHPEALTNLGNIYMEWYVILTSQMFVLVSIHWIPGNVKMNIITND
jgi:protein O-GlcNAc transferase